MSLQFAGVQCSDPFFNTSAVKAASYLLLKVMCISCFWPVVWKIVGNLGSFFPGNAGI